MDGDMSRIVLYVKESIDCKVVDELMDPEIACIWIMVKLSYHWQTDGQVGQILRQS